MKKVLFVCTGNYYRSRLAHLLFNHYAEEVDLGWKATSRGIQAAGLQGLSSHAHDYLESKGLGHLCEDARNPASLSVDDFPSVDLSIILNRAEHSPLLEKRYRWVIDALEKEGKLRWWNIYDLPPRVSVKDMMFGGGPPNFGQPPDSATEHCDFAVQALVAELKRKEIAAD